MGDRRERPHRDAGMVTAELAVGLPSLLLVTGLAVAAVAAVALQLRCVDAAAGAARLAARGQSGAVVTFVRAAGPAGASVQSRMAGPLVTVTVTDRVRLPLLGLLTPVAITGSATAPLEPGVGTVEPRS